MVRPTSRLLKTLHPPPLSHAPSPSPLLYSLGLSYASKSSPPFVPPKSAYPTSGFARQPSALGRWVDEMLRLRAGRGELVGGVEGGWTEEMQEEVGRWGAGEDFFGLVDGGGYTHLCLSDGVGGWAPQADPALFAQSLMYHYARSAIHSPSTAPWDLLKKGFEGVLADENVAMGSGTGVGVGLGETGELRGVNLGDSGVTILRRDEEVYTTPVQTHYFNCPLQLTKAPLGQSDGLAQDRPEDGFRFRYDLEPGDVVIIYTDGLSDNLPAPHLSALSSRISALLAHPSNTHLSPSDRAAERARLLADALVGYGRMAMQRTGEEMVVGKDGKKERGWRTPFEVEAEKEGLRFLGGKVDDITVMTAVVSERI
ncbi:phosphatase 2C-like domain-containing protein [Dioszegia hungarica]|uniref:Protein phosphatase n=1 Tax=Dioszegia hungarica TaxID=4972 RepID=A0AA38HAZ3_9TREE|nr:phosphatase 2C-like domain-containing protein [Dioszegia hungarica]KAI9637688.1 phosphatase 2C-like domain-containing protein [Dioszegia hungarica]